MIKPIIGYENYYSVTSKGHIISKRYDKTLKPFKDKRGYLYVDLYKNGVRKRYSVHYLVARHFVSGFEEGLVVNHKDRNITNNKAENLEWITQRENILYSNAKKVAKLDKNTLEVLKIYNSIVDAELDGFKTTEIVHCCKGRQRTHYGFKWKYV